jgi:hypothetical protein
MADHNEIVPAAAAPPPVEAVVEWLMTGASERQVQEALAQSYPDADCGGVMKTVQQYLVSAGHPDSNAVRGWALLSYRRLYQEMFRVGDYNGCRQVLKEICGMARA